MLQALLVSQPWHRWVQHQGPRPVYFSESHSSKSLSFLQHWAACGVLVPWAGIKSSSPAVEAWSLTPLDHQGSPSLFSFNLLRLRSLRLQYRTHHHKTPRRECRQNILWHQSFQCFLISGQSPTATEVTAEISKRELSKHTSFCTEKENINKGGNPTEWEKTSADGATDKGLTSTIYKQLTRLSSNTTTQHTIGRRAAKPTCRTERAPRNEKARRDESNTTSKVWHSQIDLKKNNNNKKTGKT